MACGFRVVAFLAQQVKVRGVAGVAVDVVDLFAGLSTRHADPVALNHEVTNVLGDPACVGVVTACQNVRQSYDDGTLHLGL